MDPGSQEVPEKDVGGYGADDEKSEGNPVEDELQEKGSSSENDEESTDYEELSDSDLQKEDLQYWQQVRDGKRVLDADLADDMPPEKQRKFAKKIAEYEEDADYDPNAPSSSSSSDSDF